MSSIISPLAKNSLNSEISKACQKDSGPRPGFLNSNFLYFQDWLESLSLEHAEKLMSNPLFPESDGPFRATLERIQKERLSQFPWKKNR